ncbi:hypothetical protein V6N11_061664 [Hibiscus sabdariffa]|uniref:Uncharacterized protein n=1 Tax=Hibiscus sabdariffa TaxID=183260 RepID=A0ABR2A2K7_9ROSI
MGKIWYTQDCRQRQRNGDAFRLVRRRTEHPGCFRSNCTGCRRDEGRTDIETHKSGAVRDLDGMEQLRHVYAVAREEEWHAVWGGYQHNSFIYLFLRKWENSYSSP